MAAASTWPVAQVSAGNFSLSGRDGNTAQSDSRALLFDLIYSAAPLGSNEMEVARDRIFPVCAPEIAARLNKLADLSNETLLHDGAWANDWDMWLSAQPDADGVARAGTVHSLFSVALEEARHGGGVLIAHEALVQPLLDSGELVRPFSASLDLPTRLVAETAPAFARSPIFRQVQAFLLGEGL